MRTQRAMLLGGAALLFLHFVLNRGFSARLSAANAEADAAESAGSISAPEAMHPQEARESVRPDGKYFLELDDLSVEERFDERCKYWSQAMLDWKRRYDGLAKAEVLTAIQYRSGAGDRLSGLLTALNHAVQRGRPLKFYWEDLDAAFEVAGKLEELTGKKLIEMDAGKRPGLPYKACERRSYYACDFKLHKVDRCPVYSRGCMNEKACNQIKEIYGREATQVHVFGCPMRLLISPVQDLFDFGISWFVDGRVVNGTVRDLEAEFKKYEVISMHIRVGDYAMNGISTSKLKPMINDISKCTGAVDELIQRSMRQKNVKWFLASDNPTLKEILKKKFPEKLILLEHRPRHLHKIDLIKGDNSAARSELRAMFAEWYLLGKGDHLVTNAAHEPGRGVSSFSRTAWLYSLRSKHYLIRNYDGAFCIRQEFQYEGNLNIHDDCRNNNPAILQPHLDLVKKKKRKKV